MSSHDQGFGHSTTGSKTPFNFNDLVVIPLTTYFDLSEESELPVCNIDTRTWTEESLINIAKQLEIPTPGKNHINVQHIGILYL